MKIPYWICNIYKHLNIHTLTYNPHTHSNWAEQIENNIYQPCVARMKLEKGFWTIFGIFSSYRGRVLATAWIVTRRTKKQGSECGEMFSNVVSRICNIFLTTVDEIFHGTVANLCVQKQIFIYEMQLYKHHVANNIDQCVGLNYKTVEIIRLMYVADESFSLYNWKCLQRRCYLECKILCPILHIRWYDLTGCPSLEASLPSQSSSCYHPLD